TVRPVSVLPFASLRVAVSCTPWPAGTDAVAGLTVTDATGTLVTVSAAVPLFPSLVAVSVAAPTATPVACPAPFTVATAGLLLDQVTVRPPQRIAERIPRNRRILRRLPHPDRGGRRRHAHRRDRQRAPGHRDARRRGDVPRVAGRRDREGATGGVGVVPVVALAGGARVDGTTRRAPRHGDIRA